VIVLGQQLGWAAVHYSGRQGWVERCRKLPPDWQDTIRRYRGLGAELVALYFDPTVPAEVRESYLPMRETLPLIEHRSGLWFRGTQPCEYYILGLEGLGEDGTSSRPAGPRRDLTASSPGSRMR
jgi:hypothetical protein